MNKMEKVLWFVVVPIVALMLICGFISIHNKSLYLQNVNDFDATEMAVGKRIPERIRENVVYAEGCEVVYSASDFLISYFIYTRNDTIVRVLDRSKVK